ncbi:iq calmodulin-binding motif protein [Moniliophthora roreri MCA 2997]|uniref:Iq calmodulin-binding motif protein n=1 Tax=Moniliophthora roreri (strain MCA 2997) TaxID=1381753 RepID=V2X3A2_MONRO|nr:iq calmodulin-binding motif protein [Moniliophthora roreri MCA 2997]
MDDHHNPEAKATPSKDEWERKREEAAQKIQKAWRRKNKAQQYLTSDIRWKDAAVHAKFKVGRTAADRGKNSPRERWERAIFFASQLRDGNAVLKEDNEMSEEEIADVQKQLETQHWLELVDGKHRYGSNLKWYHKRWQEEDTQDNFFKWLDQGGGKSLSLDECPRDQLEKERITYLSSEQRLNYLATIDKEGKLRWARNNELVDTTPGHWKDSGDGSGIVPEDLPERPIKERDSFESSVSSSSLDSNAATHYVDQPKGKYAWSRTLRKYFTPRGILNRLLRKTVRRNTWIWVTDRNYNLFVGIKDTGKFQHSTFLGGGLVTSAGLISVKGGLVYTLSPLSGHYRTSVAHFHKFLDAMEARGLDLRKARVSKAEAALWGIEHLAKWKKRQNEVTRKGKQKAVETGQNIALKVPMVNEGWKREVIEGRKEKRKSSQNQENLLEIGSSRSRSATNDRSGSLAEQPKQNEGELKGEGSPVQSTDKAPTRESEEGTSKDTKVDTPSKQM